MCTLACTHIPFGKQTVGPPGRLGLWESPVRQRRWDPECHTKEAHPAEHRRDAGAAGTDKNRSSTSPQATHHSQQSNSILATPTSTTTKAPPLLIHRQHSIRLGLNPRLLLWRKGIWCLKSHHPSISYQSSWGTQWTKTDSPLGSWTPRAEPTALFTSLEGENWKDFALPASQAWGVSGKPPSSSQWENTQPHNFANNFRGVLDSLKKCYATH